MKVKSIAIRIAGIAVTALLFCAIPFLIPLMLDSGQSTGARVFVLFGLLWLAWELIMYAKEARRTYGTAWKMYYLAVHKDLRVVLEEEDAATTRLP